MSKKKVIFFPDSLHETSTLIKSELGKNFLCYSSNNLDEFDQVFQQSGKFAIMYSDPQAAVKFMNQNKAVLNNFVFKMFSCLNKDGKFSAESQKILSVSKVNVYQKSEMNKLISDITKFLNESEVTTETVDDIQFIMPGDD